jgi:hypothetical protein
MTTPSADGAPDTGWYRIRVQGHLAPRWATRFEGMTLSPQEDGTTAITGAVVDQAALHGVLQKVRDTGLELVSVLEVEPNRLTAPNKPHEEPTPSAGELL